MPSSAPWLPPEEVMATLSDDKPVLHWEGTMLWEQPQWHRPPTTQAPSLLAPASLCAWSSFLASVNSDERNNSVTRYFPL